METFDNAIELFKADYNSLSSYDKEYLDQFIKEDCGIKSLEEDNIGAMLKAKIEADKDNNISESSNQVSKRTIDASDERFNKARKI
jgi:hypothetical protein